MISFEPVIVAFCCEYCAYTAADTAGSERLSYPPNIRIISVSCAARVDAIHILKAFEKGADGVFLAACLEGDCHFKNGNIRASKRVKYIRNLLEETGMGGERLQMVTLSAGMGVGFAAVANEITEKIRRVGPNPIKSSFEKG